MKRTLSRVLAALLSIVLATALCLTLYFCDNKYTHAGTQPMAGTLFVSSADWTAQPVRYLWNGWMFYPDSALTPETYAARDPATALPVRIGAYSNLSFGNPRYAAHGGGTYALTLVLPEETHDYSIELPEIFSAYRLYVGDRLLAQNGNPDPVLYHDRVLNRIVTFAATGTTRLLLVVRDQSHIYSGMVYPPAFGEPLAVAQQRTVRIVLSAGTMAATLVFAVLALWVSFHAARQQRHARLFFALCVCGAVSISYSLVHALVPMPIQPWYTVELVCGHILTLLLLVLHGRICDTPRTTRHLAEGAILMVCALSLCYGVYAAKVTQPLTAAFSGIESAFKLVTTLYLLVTAFLAIRQRDERAVPLFYADIFYATVFLWDSLLPAYEPISGGWFPEWGVLVLVGALGTVLWRDISIGYHRSLTFAEEQRQIQRQLEMQQEHYRQIAERVEAGRRQRHDFRHHLRTIAALAGDAQGQLDYIRQIEAVDNLHRPLSYCREPALDALLYYYLSAAQQQGVQAEARVELPDGLTLSAVDLCTMLGNLLENALEACARQTQGTKTLSLHIRWQFEKLYIVVKNSYDGQILQQRGGFQSRKHGGAGIGTESVRELARRLGGTVDFQPGDDAFQVVLILPGHRQADNPQQIAEHINIL